MKINLFLFFLLFSINQATEIKTWPTKIQNNMKIVDHLLSVIGDDVSSRHAVLRECLVRWFDFICCYR